MATDQNINVMKRLTCCIEEVEVEVEVEAKFSVRVRHRKAVRQQWQLLLYEV